MATGVPCPPVVLQFFLNNGALAVNGSILTQIGGANAATYQDVGLATPLPNPIPLNSRGEISDASGTSRQLFLTPNIVYTFTLFDGPNGTGNQIWSQSYINGVQLTQAAIGALLYPVSPDETTAGATVVNQWFPYGYVDRYAINTTPGTTDMSASFAVAAAVANLIGCHVKWGLTAPYRLNNPVNCTGLHGVIFDDESSGAASNSAFVSILIGHNGHTFDLATSYECTFNNLSVGTVALSVPKTLFFCARNTSGSGAGIHRFNNIRVSSNATFSWIYYGYGSEENTFLNNEWYNAQNGSGIASHNSTNPAGYISTFVSIATGSQSNADHRWLGGNSLIQFGNSGSQNEVLIQIENALNFTFRDGLMGNAHGLCYVEVLGSTASGNLTFDSIRGEPIGTQPQFGFYVTNSAAVTHFQWTFNNVTVDAPGELLHFVATNTPSIQNLAIRASTCTSGKVASIYNMSASVIETLQDSVVTGQAGGTVTGNLFIGGRNNITLNGTFSGNLYADNNLGGFGVDGDNLTSAVAACTGALTINAQWQVRLSPNGKQVTLTLPQTAGTTTASASFTYGVVLPSQYRPSSNLRQPVIIEDNGGTVNQPGQVFINASTGAITVFKDIVGTGTFTNGGTGGLPGLTELTWNL